MFEVVVDNLEYIRDVPVELTEKAVSEGLVCRGSILGLRVHTVSNPETRFIIDLRLTEEGQEKLIEKGRVIPVAESDGVLRLYSYWRDYLRPQGLCPLTGGCSVGKSNTRSFSGNTGVRPTPNA